MNRNILKKYLSAFFNCLCQLTQTIALALWKYPSTLSCLLPTIELISPGIVLDLICRAQALIQTSTCWKLLMETGWKVVNFVVVVLVLLMGTYKLELMFVSSSNSRLIIKAHSRLIFGLNNKEEGHIFTIFLNNNTVW